MVGALVGAAVELVGFAPKYPEAGETPAAALRRTGSPVALVDAGREAKEGDIVAREMLSQGARPILFGPQDSAAALTAKAARLGMRSFTVPSDHGELAELLRAPQ